MTKNPSSNISNIQCLHARNGLEAGAIGPTRAYTEGRKQCVHFRHGFSSPSRRVGRGGRDPTSRSEAPDVQSAKQLQNQTRIIAIRKWHLGIYEDWGSILMISWVRDPGGNIGDHAVGSFAVVRQVKSDNISAKKSAKFEIQTRQLNEMVRTG